MSDSREQSQPSMEEILASIRKIIAEDDPQEDSGKRAAVHPAEGRRHEQRGAPQSAPESESHSSQSDDDEVLNLTRMLGDDGGVVDLDEEPAAQSPQDSPRQRAERAAQPEPRGRGRSDAGAGVEPVVAPPSHDEDQMTRTGKAAPQPEREASARRRGDGGLLSDNSSDAASAALSEIARTVRRNRALEEEPMVTGDRSLETLVRDALGPHLKEWLDENLEPIVERVVREEVRRLARRVEDE